jgi:hypothetical protein
LYTVLKELIVGAAAIAAGLVPLSGVASADTGYPLADNDGGDVGLLNLTNLDALHNVNLNAGVCDNNINVLGVQVPVEDVANGLNVPILSPGSSEATGATPENCASSDNADGGTVQGD